MARLDYYGGVEPPFKFEMVGEDTEPIYLVNRGLEETPTPHHFDRVTELQVKLAVLGTDLSGEDVPDELDEQWNDAFDALSDLLKTMIDVRGVEGEQERFNLAMGGLDELPEVEKGD